MCTACITRYGSGNSVAIEKSPVVQEIADSVGRSPTAVVLRWTVQRGVVVIPRTVSWPLTCCCSHIKFFTLSSPHPPPTHCKLTTGLYCRCLHVNFSWPFALAVTLPYLHQLYTYLTHHIPLHSTPSASCRTAESGAHQRESRVCIVGAARGRNEAT